MKGMNYGGMKKKKNGKKMMGKKTMTNKKPMKRK